MHAVIDSHTSACPNEQVCGAERRGPELRIFLANAYFYAASEELSSRSIREASGSIREALHMSWTESDTPESESELRWQKSSQCLRT